MTATIIKGTRLVSTDSRSRGRIVEVISDPSSYGRVELRNVKTGRVTRVSKTTLREKFKQENTTGTTASFTRHGRTAKPLTNERQTELLRIVKAAFSDFNKRQQHFYLGGGISTSHVVVKTIADIKSLRIFWPPELIRSQSFGRGNTYVLEDDTLRRVQDRIRDALDQLAEKGHLEKVGNTDERRWKPTYRDVA